MDTGRPDPIASILDNVIDGRFPDADGGVTVVPPDRTTGLHPVLCFTGHAVVSTELAPDHLVALGADGYGGAHAPAVLKALAGPHGWIGVLDAVLVARGAGGGGGLTGTDAHDDHPRVRYARSLRRDVRVLEGHGGLVTLGTGIGGRLDLGFELIDESDRGSGAGRRLVADVLASLPAGQPVWASCSPGNARSLRCLVAAGFELVGSEVIIRPV